MWRVEWPVWNLRRTVDDATASLKDTAADTKTAMVALGVLGVAALAVALVALAVAIGKDLHGRVDCRA